MQGDRHLLACGRLECEQTCLNTTSPATPFQEKFPQINVEIYQGSYTDAISWLKNGVIDLAIVSEAANEGMPFIPLCEDNLICVVPKDYMPAETKCITPDDLKDQPFVIQQDSCDIDVVRFPILNKFEAWHKTIYFSGLGTKVILVLKNELWYFPDSPLIKTPGFQCRGHRFYPWLGN